MTQELDTTQPQQAEAMPLPNPTNDGLELLEKQVRAMEYAHRLATVMCNTDMVPQAFRGKPDNGAAAIMYGAELGLQPQQALQQVFVVHGQPAVYARTMVALLKSKGYRFETVESGPDAVHVRGSSPRGETEESRWTIDRAKQAGYTSNKKYATDPQAMLYAKAASEVCRRLAPDVLLGIRYAAEDLELEQPIQASAERLDGPKQRPQRGKARAALTQKRTPRQAEKAEPEGTPIEKAIAALDDAQTGDQIDRIYTHAESLGLSDDDMARLAGACQSRAEALGLADGGDAA
ncbi:hypothetical protein [Corynebacterium heidelbergense]|uniref:RecT-like ssDNA binding protein n=1 Tax=Corynebacterium heidelbergense TaxID=2055947 RepID=A0A364VDM3_9CORY|nr:hypothetical protein [Corynebacterium heidelbergense]RAV34743.1 hypothetical protein CWC39_01460 [Corynebacterium heidelbergense]WCZ37002.1 hypothetical protein CHEID_07345 [Corynebacterium heidelbergense]